MAATDLPDDHAVSPLRAGLSCCCPKCGKGKLFKGYLNIEGCCDHCGLDYDIFLSGDGPAVFLIFILGFLIIPMALIVEVKFGPPLWLHLVLWIPAIIGGALLLLRPAKGLLAALQYHFKAQEGELDR